MELVPIGHLYFEDFEVRQGAEVNSGTYFEPGDILLAKITPSFENGKQGIIRELPTPFGVATTEVIPFVGIPDVSDTLYLFYYLLRGEVRSDLAGKMEGTTGRQRLSQKAVENLRIPLPPLPEQRRIADILRAVQAAREARQREVSLERERKAALMAHLFTHGTRGEPTKQTPIGEMPVSWEVKALGELVRQPITDGVHQTPEYVPEGIPFVTAKDIVDSHIDFSHSARITAHAHKMLTQRVRPEAGDVLLTKVGTVGNVALVDGGQEFSIFVQVALIKPSPDQVTGEFLFHALQSEAVQIEIAQRSALSTMRFIGTQKIATVRVPVPQPEEQRSVAEVLHACDAKIAALERESALLDELFRALLEELMTGRVSVAEVEVEEGDG